MAPGEEPVGQPQPSQQPAGESTGAHGLQDAEERPLASVHASHRGGEHTND